VLGEPGAYPPLPRKPRPRHVWRYLALVLPAFVLVVWLDGLLTRLPGLAGTPARGERVGVIHVHSNASCGSGSLSEIIAAARAADLSFITITDHNITMAQAAVDAADPPDFAVIDGEEVSTSGGHFLALGLLDSWPRGSSYAARPLMASTRKAGAVNFIAHPYGLKERWMDWGATDYDGIEIFNDDAVWRKNKVYDIAIAALMYPVNSRLALLRLARTPQENFTRWDQLLEQRPVAGICGSDAHANIIVNQHTIAKFPSYLSVFSLARQHVLLPDQPGIDPDHAGADVILNAVKSGNSFCAVDALYPADGFTETVTEANLTAGPGNSIAWQPDEVLHVKAPAGPEHPMIRVLRDGREIAAQETQSLDVQLPGPGRYRAEAYLRQPGLTGWRRWTLWVFANPVYVTSPKAASTTVR
jgi:hypothetical protein